MNSHVGAFLGIESFPARILEDTRLLPWFLRKKTAHNEVEVKGSQRGRPELDFGSPARRVAPLRMWVVSGIGGLRQRCCAPSLSPALRSPALRSLHGRPGSIVLDQSIYRPLAPSLSLSPCEL